MSYKELDNETLEIFEHHTDIGEKCSIGISLVSGHLLIETALKALLEKVQGNLSSVELENLTYAEAMERSQAVLGDDELTWEWKAIKQLNSLRNSFSQDLKKPRFISKVDEFIDFVRAQHAAEFYQDSFSREEKLIRAIRATHKGLVQELKK